MKNILPYFMAGAMLVAGNAAAQTQTPATQPLQENQPPKLVFKPMTRFMDMAKGVSPYGVTTATEVKILHLYRAHTLNDSSSHQAHMDAKFLDNGRRGPDGQKRLDYKNQLMLSMDVTSADGGETANVSFDFAQNKYTGVLTRNIKGVKTIISNSELEQLNKLGSYDPGIYEAWLEGYFCITPFTPIPQ